MFGRSSAKLFARAFFLQFEEAVHATTQYERRAAPTVAKRTVVELLQLIATSFLVAARGGFGE